MFKINRSLAIIIGIDRYKHIPTLKNAVSDAVGLARVLKDIYGYEVLLLLNQRATKEKLDELIADLKNKTIPFDNQPIQVDKSDRVLFYFAGHGFAENAQNSEDGKPAGYFMPQDAKQDMPQDAKDDKAENNKKTWLSMHEVYEAFSNLGCHHLLIILDCCFAGRISWVGQGRNAARSRKLYQQSYDRFIKNKTEQIITSAAHDEEAQDLFRFGQRGEQNRHSPFADHLLKVLKYNPERERKKDLFIEAIFEDKVITLHELFAYLQNKLGESAKEQTPGLSQPRKFDQETGEYVYLKGEYIFPLPEFKPENLEILKLDRNSNPYKGLASFETEDSGLFFGRTTLSKELEEKVTQQTLTIVLGASGSGKSSLVKAGLIPILTEDWYSLPPIRPGESPLKALNKILTQSESSGSSIINRTVEEQVKILSGKISYLIAHNSESKLLLVIDQTEELLTLCKSQQEREDFLNLLAELLTQYPQQLRIVLALRSDFEPQLRDAVEETRWRKTWQEGRFFVTHMDREELQQAIEEPAAQRTLFFESPKLVNQLIDEAIDTPGALPLLSFTLSELYLKYLQAEENGERDDRTITQADYEQLGGVARSLTQAADKTYQKLVEEEKIDPSIIRNVMLRMVSLSSGELARRRVPTSELVYPKPTNKQVQTVIDRFVAARLLTKGLDTENQKYVEPVHDALVTGWGKIKYWLDEKQQIVEPVSWWNPIRKLLYTSLKKVPLPLTSPENNSKRKSDRPEAEKQLKVNLPLQREVTTAANNWWSKKETDGDKQAVGFLWNGDPRLPQLEQIQSSDDNWFNNKEAQFVERSIIQKRRNIRRTWIGVSVAFLTLSGFTLGIFIQLQQSELREKAARVRNLNKPLDKLILAIQATGQSQSIVKPFLKSAFGEVQASLAEAIEVARERNVIEVEDLSVVAISSDGEYIATINRDGKLSLWNLRGEEINQFETIKDVDSITFSPDSKTILIKNNKQIQRWDLNSNLIQEFSLSQKEIEVGFRIVGFRIVGFSSQDNIIAIFKDSDSSGLVQLRALNGNLIQEFSLSQEYSVSIDSVAFSPQGNTIAINFNERLPESDSSSYLTYNLIPKMQIWDFKGNLIRDFSMPEFGMRTGINSIAFNPDSIAFSPDGQRIVGSDSGKVRLWDLNGDIIGDFSSSWEGIIRAEGFTGDVVSMPNISTAATHFPANQSVTFTTDDQKIISTNDGEFNAVATVLRLWDLNGNLLQQISFSRTNAIAISRNGKYIVTHNNDNEMKWWDLEKNRIAAFSGHKNTVKALAISSDGKTIASSSDSNVHLWNLQGKFILEHNSSVDSIAISSNGETLVSGSDDGTVSLWDLQGNPIGNFQAYQNNVESVAISANGNTIVTSGSEERWSSSHEIRLWDRQGKIITKNFEGIEKDNDYYARGRVVAISSDGQTIVGKKNARTLQLWNRQGKPITKPLQGHTSNINGIAISADGKTIASVSDDGTLRLWDRQGNPIGQPFQNPVPNSVAISDDGEYIVTGGGDGRVRLWDRQGNLIGQPLESSDSSISAVAISPDKSYIVGSSGTSILSTVRLWTAGTWQNWLQIGCNRLQYHPLLKNPETEEAKGAKETCEKYVWNHLNELSPNEATPVAPPISTIPSPAPSTLTPEDFLPAPEAIAEDYYTRGSEQADDKLIVNYTQIIENPHSNNANKTDAYINRGVIHFRQKEYDLAINDYTEAIALVSNNVDAYINRGIVYSSQNNHEQAIADYDRAIALNDRNADAYISRGIAYSGLGNHEQAINDYKKAIAIAPNNADAYYALGFTLSLQEGSKQKAIQAYQKAAELYREQGKTDYSQSAHKQIEKLE